MWLCVGAYVSLSVSFGIKGNRHVFEYNSVYISTPNTGGPTISRWVGVFCEKMDCCSYILCIMRNCASFKVYTQQFMYSFVHVNSAINVLQ